LIVAEVWKGSHEASAWGITNGTQVPLSESLWPHYAPLPPGAVAVLIESTKPSPDYSMKFRLNRNFMDAKPFSSFFASQVA
jgi:hypothetical protein